MASDRFPFTSTGRRSTWLNSDNDEADATVLCHILLLGLLSRPFPGTNCLDATWARVAVPAIRSPVVGLPDGAIPIVHPECIIDTRFNAAPVTRAVAVECPQQILVDLCSAMSYLLN